MNAYNIAKSDIIAKINDIAILTITTTGTDIINSGSTKFASDEENPILCFSTTYTTTGYDPYDFGPAIDNVSITEYIPLS